MPELSKTTLNLIDVLAELSAASAATPQQLAGRLGISRAAVQRLLATLRARDLVDRADGAYSLSYGMRALAESVRPRLRHAVLPVVEQTSAQLGETVVFQIVDDRRLVVLAEAFQPREVALQVRHEVGARSDITRTASGLAILAALPADQLRPFEREPADGDDALTERLDAVRREGFARTDEELQPGVAGIAVAVHDGDEVAGSLGVLVPAGRAAELDGFRPRLVRAARRIEAALR